MAFIDDAVNKAAERVADQHKGLAKEVFPVAFKSDEIKKLIDDFDAGGDPITVECIAETLNEEMLDLPQGIDTKQVVSEFFENLEQEISQDEEIGRKLHTAYHQHHSTQVDQIRDALEELRRQHLSDLIDRTPTALTERGFLDKLSVFAEPKPSYNSFVGLYAFAHDPSDAQNRTAIKKQIDIANDIIFNELADSDKSKLRVLDIGCGIGELVGVLEERDDIEEVVGLDRSEGMVNAAKNHTQVESRIVEDNIIKKENEYTNFDIAFMFRTFTYLYDNLEVRHALKNISELLTPGGLLVFDCVDKNELWEDGHIPNDRNYSFDEPADLSSFGAPRITVDYEGKYYSEDFDEGKYIYETKYDIEPLDGNKKRSQARFEICEKEHLRAMNRNEIRDFMSHRFEIEGNQPNFNPNQNTPVTNFLNCLRKTY